MTSILKKTPHEVKSNENIIFENSKIPPAVDCVGGRGNHKVLGVIIDLIGPDNVS